MLTKFDYTLLVVAVEGLMFVLEFYFLEMSLKSHWWEHKPAYFLFQQVALK